MTYSNGVRIRILKESICKGVDMSKGNLQWWRSTPGQTQGDSNCWQGALYSLGGRAAAAGKNSWKGASGGGGSRGPSSVQQKGRRPVSPASCQCCPVAEPSWKPEGREGREGRIRKANRVCPAPCSNLEQRKAFEFLGLCLVLDHFTYYFINSSNLKNRIPLGFLAVL